MAMVANDPKAAKRLGIPQGVGQEFMKADKGRKFGTGGAPRNRPDLQKVNRPDTKHGKMELFKEGGDMKMEKKELAFLKKKGAPKSMVKHEESEMKSMKKVKKMVDGGMSNAGGAMRGLDRAAAMSGRTMPATGAGLRGLDQAAAMSGRAMPAVGRPGMKKGGFVASKMGKVVAGGKKAHGEHAVQKKGHTKGKMITMKKGGKAC